MGATGLCYPDEVGWTERATTLLAGSRLFAALEPDLLTALAERSRCVTLRAGDDLFHQGDDGDALYVVASGRLEVLVDDAVVRAQAAGEVVGELAVLRSRPRSATVRAVRDTVLLALDRAVVAGLLVDDARLAAALVEVLVDRLPQAAPAATTRRRGVVAVRPQDVSGSDVLAVADDLEKHLGALLPTAVLREDEDADTWGARLDRAERAAELVLLVSPVPGPWDDFCGRQADREVVVDRRLAAAPGSDLARLARRLAGRSVGLVLSGGGARGLAHVGVLEVLAEQGIVVERWGGTSMGALVAALAALGASPAAIGATLTRELSGRPFADYVVPRQSLIRGARARRMLDRVLGDVLIEDLVAPYFCLSCDLDTATEVVHHDGPLAEAVGASMSVPGLAPPVVRDGRVLVDGGVLNNLPIDVMVADDEGPVVAVDVMRPYATGAATTLVDTVGRAMVLGSWQKTARTRELATCVITPDLGSFGTFDFAHADRAVAAGREAAERAMDGLDHLRAR